MKIAFLTLLSLFGATVAAGQTFELIRFETEHASSPYVPSQQEKGAYAYFQLGLAVLPEEMMIPMSVIGSSYFYDFKDDSPSDVSRIASERYKDVRNDPLVGPLQSTLQYSFSPVKQDHGFYYLYRPKRITDTTQLIIFLHGFGGCFKYYNYFLKETFPDDIVVVPVYGYSGGLVTNEYLRDTWADLKGRVAIQGRKPWIIGISAGGYSVFRLYANQPEMFSGGVSIASYCPKKYLNKLSRGMSLLMINGDREQGLSTEFLSEQENALSGVVDDFEFRLVEGTHFFLFSREKEVSEALGTFIKRRAQAVDTGGND